MNHEQISQQLLLEDGRAWGQSRQRNEVAPKTCETRSLEALAKYGITEKDIARFYSKIVVGTCWLWNAPTDKDGYGQFHVKKKGYRAHKFSYVIHVGDVPEGKVVMHSCDNSSCVRPSHLRPGTQKENVQESVKRGRHSWRRRSHCVNGHAYSAANTYLDKKGVRACRICMRDRAYRQFHKNNPTAKTRPRYGQRETS